VEKTYKPDSVPLKIFSSTAVIISLGSELPRTSSDLPEDIGGASRSPHLTEAAAVFLFDLASSDAYRAGDVAIPRGGLLPRRFTLA
jgi:hypothetical protein